MSQCVGILLLLYALCLAEPKIEEFCKWINKRYEAAKIRRLRRKAAETNRQFYQLTGDDYYRQRADELEKGA